MERAIELGWSIVVVGALALATGCGDDGGGETTSVGVTSADGTASSVDGTASTAGDGTSSASATAGGTDASGGSSGSAGTSSSSSATSTSDTGATTDAETTAATGAGSCPPCDGQSDCDALPQPQGGYVCLFNQCCPNVGPAMCTEQTFDQFCG